MRLLLLLIVLLIGCAGSMTRPISITADKPIIILAPPGVVPTVPFFCTRTD